MGRVFAGLMWAGVVMSASGLYLASASDTPATPLFSCILIGCGIGLVAWWVRRRSLEADLPAGLDGLWYRTRRGVVEFHWRWSSPGRRLRILRSDSATIRTVHDAVGSKSGIVCVHDGSVDTHAVDAGLDPHTAYRYAFWTCDDRGHWSGPVRQVIMPLAPDDAQHVEATLRQDGPYVPGLEERSTLGKTLVPDPLYDPHGVDVEWARELQAVQDQDVVDGLGVGGLISIAAHIGGDAIGDGIAELLEAWPEDKLRREGWIEVV